MTINLGLLITAGIVAACGVYLLLERSLIRMLLGLLLVGNALNLVIITLGGAPGNPPILGRESADRGGDADSLAQAMILTAIVIGMGVAAFVLALSYRHFVLRTEDEVDDDPEDTKVRSSDYLHGPDRDRSDDPATGGDTAGGNWFDDEGNPIPADGPHGGVDSLPEDFVWPEDTSEDELVHEPDDGEPNRYEGGDPNSAPGDDR